MSLTKWLMVSAGFLIGGSLAIVFTDFGNPIIPLSMAAGGFIAGSFFDYFIDKEKPSREFTYLQKGHACLLSEEYKRAVSLLTRAIQLNDEYPLEYVHLLRGQAFSAIGKDDKAIEDFDVALEHDATSVTTLFNRGYSWSRKQQYDKAIQDYRHALDLDAESVDAHHGLAWLLATCPVEAVRDGATAVGHATKACEATEWTNSYCLDTLAAAYAEIGDFAAAVHWQEKAVELSDESRLEAREGRLSLYRSGQPYRDVPS